MRVSACPDAMTQVHRLFFAVQPDARAQLAAIDLANQLHAVHGLTGAPPSADRLHVTLHWLQDHSSLPPELLAGARHAAGCVEIAPFEVVFDQAGSLGEPGGRVPLVLTGSAGLAALRQLQRTLAAAMTDAGIGRYVRSRFKPHMTLLYDRKHMATQPIEPVCWTVRELVLVHSVVGERRHIVLGRWPLRSPQMGFSDW
jgi:2'-5' RNA ligase